MEKVPVQIKRTTPGGSTPPLPTYMTEGAAGMDLFAALSDELVLAPLKRALVPTGIAIALPAGFEAQIRPRSGLAARWGITLTNSPGTIDSDYRGEVQILMINLGEEPFVVRRGDRIAQLVLSRVPSVEVVEVTEARDTERGDGGFGSTGVT